MPSKSVTGHAKNVAIFQDLISFCKGFGATYNPAKANLKLTALNPQLAAAKASLQTVKNNKTAYDNATNAREIAFAPLKPLMTRILNLLATSGAAPQTVDDARTVATKIRGGRKAKKSALPPSASAEGAVAVRTASTSQQSYDNFVDNFGQLIAILSAEPKYLPNETEYKVDTLNTMITDMNTKNLEVVDTWTAISNARIDRNNIMYGELTGMTDVAQEVKNYVKAVCGPKSPQYKQVSSLQFTRPRGD